MTYRVVRVYSRVETDRIVVLKDDKIYRTYFGISEFTVADIMQAAGVDVVIGSAHSKTKFNRFYKERV